MSIEKTIRDWADRYPDRFKIENCKAQNVGLTLSADMTDLDGVSLTTYGSQTPDDVPSILTIWVAGDGTHGFAVHTSEDNHQCPDEIPLSKSSDSEDVVIEMLEGAVAAFCERYGLNKDVLGN